MGDQDLAKITKGGAGAHDQKRPESFRRVCDCEPAHTLLFGAQILRLWTVAAITTL